ncbi:MAG: hypothetical protein NVSMB64_00560 [Candidatus Velthaea sp.]
MYADLFYIDRRLKRDDEAFRAARRYAAARPGDVRFRLDVALAMIARNAPKAERELHALAASRNAAVSARARRAYAAIRRRTALRAPSQPNRLLAAAYAALRSGNRAVAIAAFQSYLGQNSRDTSALINLAYAQLANDQRADAVESIERYLTLRPSDDRVKLQLAFTLSALHRTLEADGLYARLENSSDTQIAAVAAAQRAADRSGPSASELAEQRDDARLVEAYAGLNAGATADAIAAFRAYLRDHGSAARVWLDLAYAELRLKHYTASLAAMDRYLALHPGDARVALGRAYALDANGRFGAARTAFRGLTSSADSSVSRRARAQLAADPGAPGVTNDVRVEWNSRLRDVLYAGGLQASLGSGSLQSYFAVRATSDARSHGGGIPAVYNDDAAVTALGVRFQPIAGLSLFAEAGRYVSFVGAGSHAESRYGFSYHHGFAGAPGSSTAIDMTAATYSYYGGDSIAYAGLRHAQKLRGRISALIGINAGLDTQSRYYNNFGEGFAGFAYGTTAWRFELLQAYGSYLAAGAPGGARAYWSTRPAIVFSSRL